MINNNYYYEIITELEYLTTYYAIHPSKYNRLLKVFKKNDELIIFDNQLILNDTRFDKSSDILTYDLIYLKPIESYQVGELTYYHFEKIYYKLSTNKNLLQHNNRLKLQKYFDTFFK